MILNILFQGFPISFVFIKLDIYLVDDNVDDDVDKVDNVDDVSNI